MIRNTTVPLESLRLAETAGQIDCYVCESNNTHEAEQCTHCQAPLALAHQARMQKLRPQMVAAIGASGVGKTVYLGMLLDMLSRPESPLQMLARGAFSISLQQAAVGALARCEFPHKTPNEPERWNWVHCQLKAPTEKRPVELIMPDMAGESLLQEVDHPHSYRVVRQFLGKCCGVLVLIDSTKITGGREQDYYAMKIMSYLAELDPHPKRGWSRKPVALVFTKADECPECSADPAAYAKQHLAGVWRHCQERFLQHRFFAASVAGACAYRDVYPSGRVRIPLRIEPRGVVEPFTWLIERLAKP